MKIVDSKKSKVSLLTGGDDPNYVLPLTSVLVSNGIIVDFIANDYMQDDKIVKNEYVNYYNLRGDQREDVPIREKVLRILKYYFKLMKYAAQTDSELFHIIWLNKFLYFDRIILNIYYKTLGKKLIYTAHNVNARERDGTDNFINKLTLRFMYKAMDHIFVHTRRMKQQLVEDFKIDSSKITIIPFGINNFVPKSDLTRTEARKRLDLNATTKVLLFFGRISPYKGLENLMLAIAKLKQMNYRFKLIIAGKIDKAAHDYWDLVQQQKEEYDLKDCLVERIGFIPDEDIEIYFKAADILMLPYKHIFQSGPLFLSYYFGLPVIATDVGSFREDIVEGRTGFVCRANDAQSMAETIVDYFKSDLFLNLEQNINKINKYANENYSWDKNGKIIASVYEHILKSSSKSLSIPQRA